MLYIASAFSLNMIPAALRARCALSIRTLTTEEVMGLLRTAPSGFQSVVGHENTAAVFSSMLALPVEASRWTLELDVGDRLVVGQPIGKRLPEGATVLPEGMRIEWLLVGLPRIDMSETSRLASGIDEGWHVCHSATAAIEDAGIPWHRDSFDLVSAISELDGIMSGRERRTWQVGQGGTLEREQAALAKLRATAGISTLPPDSLRRVVHVLSRSGWMMAVGDAKVYTGAIDTASQLANFDTIGAALAQEWTPSERAMIDRAMRVVGV